MAEQQTAGPGHWLARCVRGTVLACTATAVFAFSVAGGPDGPPQPQDSHRQTTGRSAPAAHPMSPALPLRVRIPSIRVDAPLTPLAIDDGGRLAAPPESDANLAGWWSRGPTPGTRGTAIIAGHVDVPTGPAVFYHLGTLRPGMHIEVTRQDGTTAHFAIASIDVYDASNFPDDKVYADTGRPELRLITCGGSYDRQQHRYSSNVVVTAHLTHT